MWTTTVMLIPQPWCYLLFLLRLFFNCQGNLFSWKTNYCYSGGHKRGKEYSVFWRQNNLNVYSGIAFESHLCFIEKNSVCVNKKATTYVLQTKTSCIILFTTCIYESNIIFKIASMSWSLFTSNKQPHKVWLTCVTMRARVKVIFQHFHVYKSCA